MELENYLHFEINNNNYQFRTICEADVKLDYLDGLKTQARFIENIPTNITFESQKQYVRGILTSANDTICGLFTEGRLIGTAGIQLSLSQSFLDKTDVAVKEIATVGIFVLNQKNRGLGLGKSMVWAATYLINLTTKTAWFGAGMEKENAPSYKAFISCGYKKFFSDEKYFKVLTHISGLMKPEIIRKDCYY